MLFYRGNIVVRGAVVAGYVPSQGQQPLSGVIGRCEVGMTMNEKGASHWNAHAKQWSHIGPPLRPCRTDIEHMLPAITQWRNDHPVAAPSVLILGVTPEFAEIPWPRGTRMFAADRCFPMITDVWPGSPETGGGAICADWLQMPVRQESIDIVMADGVFTTMNYPRGYHALASSVMNVLRVDESICLMRFFIAPDSRESVERIFNDLLNGCIRSFHAFKWRLAMALQEYTEQGVRLGDVWECWHSMGMDSTALQQRLSWPRAWFATIDAYRDMDTRYTFPRLREVRAVIAEYFDEKAYHIPDYELGERCPIFVLSPKQKQ